MILATKLLTELAVYGCYKSFS